MSQDPREYGIFTGFKFKYPEYTVVTPQCGLSYNIRGLNVDEVSQIRTSATTPAKATDMINRVLWDAVTSLPKEIKNFDEFMRYTTLKDREALMFGLYVMTFGDEREFKVSCDECSTDRQLKVKLTNIFSINPYPASNGMMNTYNLETASGVVPDEEMENIKQIKNASKTKKVLQRPQDESPLEEKMENIRNKALNPSADDFDNPEDDGIGVGAPVQTNPLKSRQLEEDARMSNLMEEPPERLGRDPRLSTPIEDFKNRKSSGISEISQDMLNILNMEVPVELPVSKIIAVIHQPKIYDEYEILNNVPFLQKKQTDIINETLIIKRFEEVDPTQSRPNFKVMNREDIIRGYKTLPNIDKKEIYKAFKDNFADYGIELKANWDCLNCGAENQMEINIVTQFFRMVVID